MRRSTYDKGIRLRRLNTYPERQTRQMAPELNGLTRHWSLRQVGTNQATLCAADSALIALTGHEGRFLYSAKAVAAMKVRQEDTVGCMVRRSKHEAWALRETWVTLVLPRMGSTTERTTDVVDKRGGVTIPVSNPMLFPSMESVYEMVNPRCSRPGLSLTFHHYPSSAPYVEHGRNRRKYVIAWLKARGVPMAEGSMRY